ncbi:PREDICTED: copper-transporting ATPase PAA1, chloroplastic isoform X3 [Tarenaya hassleriana]|uniref:copper-transporting ATPase PAA1, chloroplastic isoform X3 n=1 Tax=Tarenaya hassleriana TaxID=28532 RepID=UPI00053C3AB0|nr:PREDICTED: copper-transporting ATPase PAA1, chloroplastic isoform X3 [Tarenaya hassleriana]
MESRFVSLSTATATTAAARTGGASLPLLTISKALHRHLASAKRLHPLLLTRSSLPHQLATRRLQFFYATRFTASDSSCYRASSAAYYSVFRSLCAAVAPEIQRRLQCSPSSAASFGTVSGGGLGGGGTGGSGGGGGRWDGGDSESKLGAGAGDGVPSPSSDVIILDVGGMTCGGCAASVKKILESQPQVSTASVNLTTETAIVWPVLEAKSVPNWKEELGEMLAKHLSNCGFESTPRGLTNVNFFRVFESKMKEKHTRLKESGRELAVSWALCAVCVVGHLTHFLGVKVPWIHAFHSTGFHVSLSLLTLLGPGRQLIIDGIKSLLKGAPNMNTLVGLGALSSFTVSSLAAMIPKLGWKTFFEEPVMLIAFILLGRNLEQRAKIKATSDMTGLLSVLPSKARLLLDGDPQNPSSTVEVPCNSLSVGDLVVILPGDRVPADGIVRSGRSTIDESSLTGEPLPVTKESGSQVAAGCINLNGTLTVEVRRSGGETAVGDIVRLVEEAQSREAPVQRLVDKVAGRFTYGVMALSAATFMFWNLFGSYILPSTLHNGSPASLALQLSCSVLVVACPCALGLATPTAMLVGISLGARRGLLLRGGDILEKFASVDTVVFDKTGTLTRGHPVVTKVVIPEYSRYNLGDTLSEVEVLKLAASVESNTSHPVGKAIIEAARNHNCQIIKVEDGTFSEEPGSGAVAIVNNKRVTVGTLDWLQRHGVAENPLHAIEGHEFKSQSTVYIGVDNTLAALICFEDKVREDAQQVVENLSRQGIDVYMLSGDKRNNANYVASVVGIPQERVIAGVKPGEKKRFINELQKTRKGVAMVGDGINDAAALASSDVGVAMGGGVGAASEVSPIVLMSNRLSQLLEALELSRQTMKTVKQNLWWAFGYNITVQSRPPEGWVSEFRISAGYPRTWSVPCRWSWGEDEMSA